MTPTGEVTHDIYYQKYLKYKAKYLELKRLLGGGKCGTKCYSSSRGKHEFGYSKYCKHGGCCNCGCKK